MGDLNFDPNSVEVASFSPLPAGEYVAAIVKSDWKKTKSGTGQYLELIVEILDGESKGRRVFDRLNLHNSNPKAVEIAEKRLKQICKAQGKSGMINDSAELWNHTMRITTKVTTSGEWTSAEIVSYSPRGSASAAPADKAPWE